VLIKLELDKTKATVRFLPVLRLHMSVISVA